MNLPAHPAAVIGGGPAGLMAAETIACAGLPVQVFEAMPAPGRKFLMAGRGGLNLTHAEPLEQFRRRYGARQREVSRWLDLFGPQDLRAWVHALGIQTFVGSSGRVFPEQMKAAPLLRAWLKRLEQQGVQIFTRHRWLGWDAQGALRFQTPAGEVLRSAAAVVLAPGGASWPHLGSDAAWVALLQARGIPLAPLQPANCGFEVAWSAFFRQRFAGSPLKTVRLRLPWMDFAQRGECVVSAYGLEGSLIYAASAYVRERIQAAGQAEVRFDLLPDIPLPDLQERLGRKRGKRSLAEHLRRTAHLNRLKIALLREALPPGLPESPAQLAALIKDLPLTMLRPRPLEEAISTAGGVRLEALTESLMLRAAPGVFCAGEMLDWEAPTGGYLLTACFASGVVAGRGVITWMQRSARAPFGVPSPH